MRINLRMNTILQILTEHSDLVWDFFYLILGGSVAAYFVRKPSLRKLPITAPLRSTLAYSLQGFERVRSTAQSFTRWNADRLKLLLHECFERPKVCVISNREPYIHNREGKLTKLLRPASGLVTALEPIVKACSGLWIAHGSGSADRETADKNGKLQVPPENPEYLLKRVWLSKEDEDGYYFGFSNEGLWPLCHIAHTKPQFDEGDWTAYQKVNQQFARALVEEKLPGRPVILVQDYHFALLPKMVRRDRPDALISLFWHIPWPNPEIFGICPWNKELLTGMLASDLVGFHTQFHCNNFFSSVERYLEARVDRETSSVSYQNHVCTIKPFPIGVDWPNPHAIAESEFDKERVSVFKEYHLPLNVKLGIGVDRADYTKGIVERFRSIERFLEQHPEWLGRFSFIQIASPCRSKIPRYLALSTEIEATAEEINERFKHAAVPPIILKLKSHTHEQIHRLYRASDFCLVTPLHDGMNLVAKEFVSARSDLQGVLILSHFAGASIELNQALLINPYSADECARALHRAITMPPEEQAERMRLMRENVSEKNVYAWAGNFLSEISRVGRRNGFRTKLSASLS